MQQTAFLNFKENEVMSIKEKIRTLIAIGDLHGDYYRLIRILSEKNLIDKKTLKWDQKANNIDLVFIGDYVDWRGEPLEGPGDDLNLGSRNILYFLKNLHKDLKLLRSKEKKFKTKIHLILGNHDEMMLESLEIFKAFTSDQIDFILENTSQLYLYKIEAFILKSNLNAQQVEVLSNFLNWFSQGGDNTVKSFGDLSKWRKALEGKLGKFLKKNLKLAVVINKNFFSHSIPDEKKYWKPLRALNKDLRELPEEEKKQLKRAFLWSRKISGYDYLTGFQTTSFKKEEIDELLKKLKVKRVIIGHTPMRSLKPIYQYDGKVVNIDLHGVPGSSVYVEEH